MRYRLVGIGLPALLAGCTNNNINVTVTAAVQTQGANEGSSEGSNAASDATAAGVTTGEPDTADSTGTGAPPAETSDGTTGGASTGAPGDPTGDPDTTSGGPLVPPRYVVLSQCIGSSFLVADLNNDWVFTSKALPDASGALEVGVSDQHVYEYALDTNIISRYGFDSNAWTPFIKGPVAITHKNGWVEWVGGEKVCMAFFGRQELHCHDGESWRMIPLTTQTDLYASWDPETNELYIKPYGSNGFQVVDLDTDTIVRTIVGQPNNPDIYRCTYDYHDGHVYMDDYPRPLKLDSQTGTKIVLPIDPMGDRGGGVHPTENTLYMMTDITNQFEDVVQAYDLETDVLTLLPFQPALGRAYRLVFQAPSAG